MTYEIEEDFVPTIQPKSAHRVFVVSEDVLNRLRRIEEAAQAFKDDALAAPLDEFGVRHYDLAFHGGYVGDLFDALASSEAPSESDHDSR